MARAALAVVAAAAILCACASDTGPKPAPLVPLERGAQPKVVWSASAGDADRFVFSPAFADGAVYTAARNGTVTRFDAASGRRIWSAEAGTRLSGGVGTDGRIVAVANEDGEVIALDAENGKKRWTAPVSSEVIAAPAVGADLVLVRSIDNRVAAFGAQDGKRRWVYQRSPSSLIIRTPSGITIDGDTAFAGFAGGRLVALALANGGVRWEATVALPKGATELERVADVVGVPAVQEREVCAATYQGRVGCYEIANGRQVWARDISTLTGVALDARYAFVADEKGAVQAFDRTNGRSVWKQDKLANRQLSLPQPFGEVVAVGDFEGYVHFLARETGAFVGRYGTGGGPVRAAPRPIPGALLIETQSGALYALAP
ncbi:MAG TPA: outer membrane protein assembly factor BamB [Burkholderiales bacterium]|nr:outer membrane protein assembly factor BamB [Burkholderiales bacterium]